MKLKKKIIEFLSRNGNINNDDGCAAISNARRADETAGLPKNVWLEATDEYRRSRLNDGLVKCKVDDSSRLETAFMAGFYCGFLQFNKKKKK